MRRGELVLVASAALALAACGPVAVLTKPEGDGGWSVQRRQAELAARAAAAAVPLDGGAGDEAPVPAGPLALPDVVELAAQRNRRILEARYALDAAGARVRDARGRLLPATTGTGRYTWYTDPLTTAIELPPGLLPPGAIPPVVAIREAEVGRVSGTVAVPLDLSGELWTALRSAQAGYRGEAARLWATTLQEQLVAIRAYFGLLEAQRLRLVTRGRIAAQEEQRRTAQARYDAGRLTRNELLVVQVALSEVQQELVARELAVDQWRWALNDATGRPVDAPTEVQDVLGEPALPAADAALADAFAHNPVLASLLEEQQRLEEAARSLARSRLPRFEGGGSIDWTSEQIVQPDTIGGGYVGFSWDLGTDGRREARLAEARIEADRNRTAIERELRGLESAVRQTRRAVEERLAALAAARTAVTQADENLRIRQQQFESGRATSEDVLDAETRLAAQRATLATALYQAHTRRAELQQLLGLPLAALAATTR
ncbi:MAG: TolC family protein [bacterium]|nr:TolC family protein [bacterium]